jgi:hypothetical protein
MRAFITSTCRQMIYLEDKENQNDLEKEDQNHGHSYAFGHSHLPHALNIEKTKD